MELISPGVLRAGHDFSESHPVSREVIEYTVVYLTDGIRVLMIERNDKPLMGRHLLGPGGRMESGETPVAGARRELREESGIDILEEQFDPAGVFVAEYQDQTAPVYFFRARIPYLSQIPLQDCSEGKLGLYTIDDVPCHPLSPSSQQRYFLPVMYGNGTLYQGVGWYMGRDMVHYIDNVSVAEYNYQPHLLRRLRS
jgi:8-oxo-dGTP diphosphatase